VKIQICYTYCIFVNLHSSLIISYRSVTNNINLRAIFERKKLGNSPVLIDTLTNISRTHRRFYVHDENIIENIFIFTESLNSLRSANLAWYDIWSTPPRDIYELSQRTINQKRAIGQRSSFPGSFLRSRYFYFPRIFVLFSSGQVIIH